MKVKRRGSPTYCKNEEERLCIIFFATFLLVTGNANAQSNYDPLAEAKIRFEKNLSPKTRVVGGRDTTIAENPWQVALLYSKDQEVRRAQFCGGTFIANGWVLTAAHCVDSAVGGSDVHVYISTERLSSPGKRIEVEKIIIHPAWNRSRFDSDIAILKMSKSDGRKYLSPIGLDEGNVWPLKIKLRVTGWGMTSSRGAGMDILQSVELPLVNFLTCGSSYGSRVTPNMICAGERGADACGGDSGGPASTELNGKRLLVGVTSWGDGCGIPTRYGVFVKVANFSKWIKTEISE